MRRVLRAARMAGASGDEPDGRRRQDHQARGRAGEDDRRGHRAGHRDLPSGSRVPPHPAGRGLSEGDRLHPADGRARRAADRARRGVQGGGRLGLLRDRQVPRLRQALAPRHARGEDAARACSRTTTRRRTRRTSRSGRRPSPRTRRSGAAWDSPWGRGRPGWHLECSAMAMDLLGETLDLHCGGIDLVFPHHEDEIAQSEAATGKPFARMWSHGAFLLMDGAKMAKRVGNVAHRAGAARGRRLGGRAPALRVQHPLPQGVEPLGRGARASVQGVRRVGDFHDRLFDAATLSLGGTAELSAAADEAVAAADAALFDDLNGPEALAALFNFIRRGECRARSAGWRPRRRRAGAGGVRAHQRRARHRARTGRRGPVARGVDRGADRCAAGGACAAGFRRGGPDPGRVDGPRRDDRRRRRGDEVEAHVSDVSWRPSFA